MGGKDKIKHVVVRLNEIKLFKMTMKDFDQMIEIYKSFWGVRGLNDPIAYQKIIEQNLSYVYKIGNELIAFCLVEYLYEKNNIEINLLCVKEEYKGMKFGKNLLSFCINNCKKKKYKHFSLHVSTKNIPALNLYKTLGFEIKSFIRKYYNDEDPNVNDAYYMTLSV